MLLPELLRYLLGNLLRIQLLHRVDLEWQHAAELAGDAAQLVAEPRLTEQPADGAAERLAELTHQIAEQPLRCQLLHWLLLHRLLLHRLLLHPLLLLHRLLLGELLKQLLSEVLCVRLLYRVGLEWQQAAELAGDTADLAAERRLPDDAADGSAKRATELADEIAEHSLRRELLQLLLCIGLLHRICAEGQQATELAGDATDLAAQAGLSEQPADGAAGRLA